MTEDQIRNHPLYIDWRNRVLAAMEDPEWRPRDVAALLDEKPAILGQIQQEGRP